MLIPSESTAFYIRAGRGWKLVTVVAGGRSKPWMLVAMTVSPLRGIFI